MKKSLAILAAIVAATLPLGLVASPAGAETMYRNGASKVTIKPTGAPAGAYITKARVTVKKGKKTVARNRPSYLAKRGTYKAASTVTYRRRADYIPADWAFDGTCTVDDGQVIQDNTAWNWDGIWEVTGTAVVAYDVTCTDWFYAINRYGTQVQQTFTWNTTWLDDDEVYFVTETEGDWEYAYSIGEQVSPDVVETMPTVPSYADQLTTKKSTRTVVVR